MTPYCLGQGALFQWQSISRRFKLLLFCSCSESEASKPSKEFEASKPLKEKASKPSKAKYSSVDTKSKRTKAKRAASSGSEKEDVEFVELTTESKDTEAQESHTHAAKLSMLLSFVMPVLIAYNT